MVSRAHHLVTKSWKSLVKTPCGSLGGGCGRSRRKTSVVEQTKVWTPAVQTSVFPPDLVDNVVQQFKDGHGRSTVHPVSYEQIALRFDIKSDLNHSNTSCTCLEMSKPLTAHRPAWWSRSKHVGVSLSLSPVHNGTTEDGLQLFGVWWRDGVAANRQLYQGQAHAPHVGLNRVVSALQSLRLLRSTTTSEKPGRANMARKGLGREGTKRIGKRGRRCYSKRLDVFGRKDGDSFRWKGEYQYAYNEKAQYYTKAALEKDENGTRHAACGTSSRCL